MKQQQGYYGIVAVDGIWKRYALRDARATERFYRRPPEGKIISVGYRITYRTLPIVSGWTINGTGSSAQLLLHGAQDIFTVPAWAHRVWAGNFK